MLFLIGSVAFIWSHIFSLALRNQIRYSYVVFENKPFVYNKIFPLTKCSVKFYSFFFFQKSHAHHDAPEVQNRAIVNT
jgi:hypothetical protein